MLHVIEFNYQLPEIIIEWVIKLVVATFIHN